MRTPLWNVGEPPMTVLAAVDRGVDFNAERGQEEATTVARAAVDRGLGDDVRAKGRVGDVTDETATDADQLDARYLVIAGRKRSPVGKALF